MQHLKKALVMGIQDYIRLSGATQIVIGLSGGIDSAVVAALAVEAIGSNNVLGITLPSPYSSEGSYNDSETLAKQLKIECKKIPINDSFQTLLNTLSPHISTEGLVEENLQARIRGIILMAISNATGRLVLTTGNKSEIAVGYCTLYGDMCGALAPIGDLWKTEVYELADHLSIPKGIIDKEPSAELRHNQKDQDSLPPYPLLDAILKDHIESFLDENQLIQKGYPEETIKKVINLVKKSEYKRAQAPPILKVSSCAFGTGRKRVIN